VIREVTGKQKTTLNEWSFVLEPGLRRARVVVRDAAVRGVTLPYPDGESCLTLFPESGEEVLSINVYTVYILLSNL